MSYLLPADGVETAYLPALGRPVRPVADLRACWQIFRLLCRTRPHLVHTHMAKAGTVGRLAAIAYNLTAGRHAPAKLVHTYHGHVFEGYFRGAATAFFLALERLLASRTDALIAVSPQVGRELVSTYRIGKADQFRVIRLGFDLASFAEVDDSARLHARDELGLPRDALVVTTVGRLTPIKQHQLFLDVARLLLADHPRAVFLIAGDGELRRDLEQQARDQGLGDRVRFLGWRRDLARIYAATDAFLLTSRNEGTPVALIEAMASGVPGVSTDVGGVRDVITGQDLGVLVPFGAPEPLAAAVSDLLSAPERRALMGERARRSVLDRYALQRLVTDIAVLYRTLLD